jgi:hypothetical protein
MFAAWPAFFLAVIPCFFIVGLLGTIFWIWALIDCLTKEPDEGNSKLVWGLVILFLHFFGALLYFLIRRPQRMSMYGR